MKYKGSQYLDLIRSPETVADRDLQEITEFQKRYDKKGILQSIEILRDENLPPSKHFFGYKPEVMEKIGKAVHGKDSLNDEEWKALELVFIQATLNRMYDPHGDLNLLVTQNDSLLDNRLWFECHFPGGMLNIVTLEEAVEIVDLFLKHNGQYPISYFINTNKGYWYWLSFRTKVAFYNVDAGANALEKSILDTFAQRFVFLLMSVDEIGFQFYSGANNDTMESTIYHFNYLISLITGIFDSLALQTFNQYELHFKDSHIPSRISLHSKTGKHFLRAVRERNPALRRHISNYVHFINAVYLLRDRILHREGLQETAYEHRGRDEKWQANFILIPEELSKCLNRLGDREEKYEPWTRLGICSINFLEPYKFAKSAVLILSTLCNEYLRLLGFSNFEKEIEEDRPDDDFTRTLRDFRSDNLGL